MQTRNSRPALFLLPLVIFLLSPLAAQAADLLQVYQQARENDLEYRTERSRFEADVLARELGRARSLPQLNYNYRLSRNDYSSSQQHINLGDVSAVDFQGCSSSPDPLVCLLDGLEGVQISDSYDSTFTAQESSLSLTQVLFDPEVGAERGRGNALALQAAARMAAAEKSLIQRVLDGYLNVLAAVDQKRLAKQLLESISTQQQIAERRYQLGVGKETEVYDAQAAYDMQQTAYETARARETAALRALADITGNRIAAVKPVSKAMPVEPLATESENHWMALALEKNDAIKAAEAGERIAYYEMRGHRLARLPRVNLAARYHERELEGGQGFTPESTTASIGLDVRLPLYQGGAMAAARKQSAHREVQAEENLRLQKRKVETAIANSLMLLDNDVSRYQSRRRAVESSAKSLAITRRAYVEGGSSTLLDLFRAQEKHYEARQKLATVRYDYLRRVFELKRLAGTLSQADIREVNGWLQRDGEQ